MASQGGRERQKRRTRRAILAAAAELARTGREPTIDEVADAADVSRRTAYRYFPTHEQLLTEATLEAVRPEVEQALAKVRWHDDAEARLDQLVQTVQRLTLENEQLLRSMIRLTVGRRNDDGWVRGQRRTEWIESAIEPLRERLRPPEFERLVSALSLCLGIEAVLVLRDVRGLSARQTTEVARWAASALLRASLQGEPSSPPTRATRNSAPPGKNRS